MRGPCRPRNQRKPKSPAVTCWGGPYLKAKHRRCRPLSHDRRDGDSLRPLSYRFASFARGTLALPWPRYDERLIRPTGHGAKGGDRRQAQHPLRTQTHWAVSRLRLRLEFATSFCRTSECLRCALVRACSASCGWAAAYPVAMSPMAPGRRLMNPSPLSGELITALISVHRAAEPLHDGARYFSSACCEGCKGSGAASSRTDARKSLGSLMDGHFMPNAIGSFLAA